MKNTILFIGGVLLILNSLFGLILSFYPTANWLLGDLSIALTSALFYITYNSKTADGFKIGYTLLFAFTGLIRFICAILSPDEFTNNIALIVFICLIGAEGFFLFLGNALKNK